MSCASDLAFVNKKVVEILIFSYCIEEATHDSLNEGLHPACKDIL